MRRMAERRSLGTFTSRFTKSVGVTSILYRKFTHTGLAAGATLPGPRRPPRQGPRTDLGSMTG
jgi:hypothetical protein